MGVDDFKRSFHKRTVCEVTREIYDILFDNREKIGDEIYSKIFSLLQEQMRMQKRMDLKLRKYKSSYDDDLSGTKNFEEKDKMRASRENM